MGVEDFAIHLKKFRPLPMVMPGTGLGNQLGGWPASETKTKI
jgi:hypothetical protein